MKLDLKRLYKQKIVPSMIEEFGYKNIEQVPKLVKISINRGFGEASKNSKELDASVKEMSLIIGQKLRVKSMAVANGQFLVIKKSAYVQSGGHESIKAEVLDDIMIARQLLSSGFSGGVAEASQVASCQMYKTAGTLINGYRKSLWNAFGSLLGTFVAIIILLLSSVAPFIASLFGSKIGLISFGLIVLSRVISSIRTGSIPNTAVLHPLAIVLLISLIIYSWIGKLTNTLTWRDRKLS